MGSSNDNLKRKYSLETESIKERNYLYVSPQVTSTKLINSGDDKTLHKNKKDLVKKFSRKEKNMENGPGPGNNGYLQSSTTRAADEKHDKAPPKKFTGIGKRTCNEIGQEDQEGCVADSSKLESHAGFVDRVRQESQDPPFHSQENLSPENMESWEYLEASMTQLKNDTCRLSRRIQKHAIKCQQLSEANKHLLDELRKHLHPSIMEVLEARNPDPEYRSRFATDKEASSQNRESPST